MSIAELIARVREIAHTKTSQGRFDNPFKKHEHSTDALFYALYEQYQDELCRIVETQLEMKGLARAEWDDSTRVLELLNKGFAPSIIRDKEIIFFRETKEEK